jgi:hypothetical protein
VQSALARARNSVIATAILLLLVFAGFVQAAGDAAWEDGVGQVNNALRQMRQQAQGVPGAMQYVNQAEKLWKQAQAQWAMQQQYQQQNLMNQMRTQLLAQQQTLINQLNKQQQFLQQQLAYLNTPLKKRMDENSLQHFGRLLQPDMNAKGGPGMEVWKEAMRQLDSISSESPSFSTPRAASSRTSNNKGNYDNPLVPELLREDDSKKFGYPLNVDESSIKPYSAMSDERLEKKREALIKALKETQELSVNNVNGYSQVETDATAGKEKAWQVVQDASTTVALGVTQDISNKNDMRKLLNAVNADPGPNKIDAMRQSVTAAKLDGDVEKAAQVVDVDAFTDLANKGELGEAIGQGAMMLGGALIKSPSQLSPTPLAAIPGAVKLGFDTALVGLDYYVRNEEYERQEQLRKQLEANRLKLSKELKEVIEEQNRRKSAYPW